MVPFQYIIKLLINYRCVPLLPPYFSPISCPAPTGSFSNFRSVTWHTFISNFFFKKIKVLIAHLGWLQLISSSLKGTISSYAWLILLLLTCHILYSFIDWHLTHFPEHGYYQCHSKYAHITFIYPDSLYWLTP